MGSEATTDIDEIAGADVVYVLRMQRERMEAGANYRPSLREYAARWGMSAERLRPGQRVMHPGPDEPRRRDRPTSPTPSRPRHQDQVRAGLVVRMAVLVRPASRSGPRAVRVRGGGRVHRLFGRPGAARIS